MSIESQIAEVIRLSAASLLLWLLAAWLVMDYRLDRTRQKLFAVRDSLFDYAATGAVHFENPAYQLLRDYMNVSIRFMHGSNLLTILAMYFVIKASKSTPTTDPLTDAINRQPENVRNRLLEYRLAAQKIVVDHVFFGSADALVKFSIRKPSSGSARIPFANSISTQVRSVDLIERSAH